MHTDHTLPSDSTMTVDAYGHLFRKGVYTCKEKEQRGRFGENNARGVYIDWSQSKVFLVNALFE